MADATTHSGTISALVAGSTVLAVGSIGYAETCATDDVTTTQSNGFQVLQPTIRSMRISASGAYDFAANYGTSPPNIITGQTVTMHAKPDGSADYTGPCIVTSFNWDGGPQAGAVKWSGEFMSSGAFTRPAT